MAGDVGGAARRVRVDAGPQRVRIAYDAPPESTSEDADEEFVEEDPFPRRRAAVSRASYF